MNGNKIDVTIEVGGMQVVGHAVSYGSRVETEVTAPFHRVITSTFYVPAAVPKTNNDFREYVEMLIRRSVERHFRKRRGLT